MHFSTRQHQMQFHGYVDETYTEGGIYICYPTPPRCILQKWQSAYIQLRHIYYSFPPTWTQPPTGNLDRKFWWLCKDSQQRLYCVSITNNRLNNPSFIFVHPWIDFTIRCHKTSVVTDIQDSKKAKGHFGVWVGDPQPLKKAFPNYS